LNGIKGDKKENKSDDEEGLVGTEDYIAPECLRTEKDTCQCDLWSLGVIIFELFTGKTPFKGANQTETFENILAGRMVQDFPEKMTEPTKDLITKLL
jgi:serine/threonine protein kinase